jgi:rubrerythrin
MKMNPANAGIMIVNNTGEDIDLVRPYLLAYAKGKPLHEDIADIFTAERIAVDGQVRVIVDFCEDQETVPLKCDDCGAEWVGSADDECPLCRSMA